MSVPDEGAGRAAADGTAQGARPPDPGQEPARAPAAPAAPAHHLVRRTRVGGIWVASGLFALVLLFLLIFILQNSQDVKISYLGAHGQLPLGVALLLAAVFGILLVAVPGTGRILQLRRAARRHRKAGAPAPSAQMVPAPDPGQPKPGQ